MLWWMFKICFIVVPATTTTTVAVVHGNLINQVEFHFIVIKNDSAPERR